MFFLVCKSKDELEVQNVLYFSVVLARERNYSKALIFSDIEVALLAGYQS